MTSTKPWTNRYPPINLVWPGKTSARWNSACRFSDILDARQVAPDEYEFLLGFVTENGSRFDYSICCGYFEPVPSETWFVYSVTVKEINGQWLVMGASAPTTLINKNTQNRTGITRPVFLFF